MRADTNNGDRSGAGRGAASGWLANRRTRTKVLLAVSAMALTALLTGGLAVSRMAAMNRDISEIRAQNVQDLLLLSDMRGSLSLINHNAALSLRAPNDAKVQAESVQGTAAAVERLDTSLAAYLRQPIDEEERQTIAEFTELWRLFTDAVAATQQGKAPTNDLNMVVPAMEKAVDQLSDLEAKEVEARVVAAHAHYGTARLQVVVALTVGLLAAGAIALLISASMTRRLR